MGSPGWPRHERMGSGDFQDVFNSGVIVEIKFVHPLGQEHAALVGIAASADDDFERTAIPLRPDVISARRVRMVRRRRDEGHTAIGTFLAEMLGETLRQGNQDAPDSPDIDHWSEIHPRRGSKRPIRRCVAHTRRWGSARGVEMSQAIRAARFDCRRAIKGHVGFRPIVM